MHEVLTIQEELIFDFFPLLLVLLLAFFVPILLARVRQVPVVVGEILAGVIIGRSVLGLVEINPILSFMGDIGLAFLMFLAGMEIDFGMLFPKNNPEEDNGPNLLGYSLIVYAITLALAIPGGILLDGLGMQGSPWLLAFILAATSLGVLMPVLKERHLTKTRFGQAIFITASLADFITVILLTVFVIIQSRGLDPQILGISLLFVFFFLAYRLGIRFTRIPGVRAVVGELSKATVQLKVRGAITLMLAFVVLAEFLGAELILGAFLAGMVISLVRPPRDEGLVHNLEAFGFGFFIPVFFILVGADLRLGALLESPESLLLLPLFLLISVIIKVVPAIAYKRFMSWREMLGAGILLNTHLSLEIAVAIVGSRTGLLSEAATTAITLFAVLTVIIMPTIFGALVPSIEGKKKRSFLICGAGSEGLNVAKELRAHGEEVRFIDYQDDIVDHARNSGLKADYLRQANIKEIMESGDIKGVLALCPDDDTNLEISRAASSAGIRPVIARVNNPQKLREFKNLPIQPFVPTVAQPTLLALMARNPAFFDLLTSATDNRDVREVSLRNAHLDGLLLRDLRLPAEILIVAIGRDGQVIVPNGNVELEIGDRLTLLGSHDELNEAVAILRD